MYYGEIDVSQILTFKFTTRAFTTGAPTTLGGTPALSVYKEGSTTESTSGVTLTADYDSRTGLNNVVIDTSSDGTFYATGKEFDVVITTGTVDGVSVVGEVVGHFCIRNRADLKPTTAGRTLVVDAAGLADANMVKVGPTGSGTAQTAKDIGGAVPSVAAGAAGGLMISGSNTGPWTVTGGVTFSNSGGDAFTCSSSGNNGSGFVGAGNGSGHGYKGTGGATGHGARYLGGATSGSGMFASAATSGDGFTGVGGGNGHGFGGTGTGIGNGFYGLGGNSSNGDGAHFVGGTGASVGIRGIGGGTSGEGALFTATAGNSAGMTLTHTGSGKDFNATTTPLVLAKTTNITGFNDIAAGDVWDVVLASHVTAGSTGFALNAAGSAGDPWGTALPGAYGAGTAGHIIGTAIPDIAPGSANGLLRGGTNSATTVNITGTITTVTNLTNLPSIPAGWITAAGIATDAIDADALAPDAVTEIAGAVWDVTLASHVAAGSTGFALNAAGSAGDPWGTALPGAYGAGTAGNIVGNNLNAAITSRMASYAQPAGFLAATFPATVGDATAATQTTINNNVLVVPALVWSFVVEGAITAVQMLRGLASFGFGLTSGGSTATIKFRDMGNTKDRIVATCDVDGNRTVIVKDLT